MKNSEYKTMRAAFEKEFRAAIDQAQDNYTKAIESLEFFFKRDKPQNGNHKKQAPEQPLPDASPSDTGSLLGLLPVTGEKKYGDFRKTLRNIISKLPSEFNLDDVCELVRETPGFSDVARNNVSTALFSLKRRGELDVAEKGSGTRQTKYRKIPRTST